jgi:hypothetical protein
VPEGQQDESELVSNKKQALPNEEPRKHKILSRQGGRGNRGSEHRPAGNINDRVADN